MGSKSAPPPAAPAPAPVPAATMVEADPSADPSKQAANRAVARRPQDGTQASLLTASGGDSLDPLAQKKTLTGSAGLMG